MREKGIPDDQGSIWMRLAFRILGRRTGGVPAPLRVYGWKPRILYAFLGLGRMVRKRGELPERLKRLAMYWTARKIECSF